MFKNRQNKHKVIEIRILVTLEQEELAGRGASLMREPSEAWEMFYMLIWLHKNLYIHTYKFELYT